METALGIPIPWGHGAMSASQSYVCVPEKQFYSVGSFSGVSNVCDIVMYVINFNLLVSNIFLWCSNKYLYM